MAVQETQNLQINEQSGLKTTDERLNHQSIKAKMSELGTHPFSSLVSFLGEERIDILSIRIKIMQRKIDMPFFSFIETIFFTNFCYL